MKAAQITVRMTDLELSKLREMAARQSVPVSDIVRDAIASQLDDDRSTDLRSRLLGSWAG